MGRHRTPESANMEAVAPDSWQTIAVYIAKCRSHGLAHKFGGCAWMVDEADEALKELAKLRQPAFWSQFPQERQERGNGKC